MQNAITTGGAISTGAHLTWAGRRGNGGRDISGPADAAGLLKDLQADPAVHTIDAFDANGWIARAQRDSAGHWAQVQI